MIIKMNEGRPRFFVSLKERARVVMSLLMSNLNEVIEGEWFNEQ